MTSTTREMRLSQFTSAILCLVAVSETDKAATERDKALQRHETKLQRVATSCVATNHLCLLRDKTEKQTHDVSVGLLTQYVSLLRVRFFCCCDCSFF